MTLLKQHLVGRLEVWVDGQCSIRSCWIYMVLEPACWLLLLLVAAPLPSPVVSVWPLQREQMPVQWASGRLLLLKSLHCSQGALAVEQTRLGLSTTIEA